MEGKRSYYMSTETRTTWGRRLEREWGGGADQRGRGKFVKKILGVLSIPPPHQYVPCPRVCVFCNPSQLISPLSPPPMVRRSNPAPNQVAVKYDYTPYCISCIPAENPCGIMQFKLGYFTIAFSKGRVLQQVFFRHYSSCIHTL